VSGIDRIGFKWGWPMNGSPSFLQQLDESISRGSGESRLRALWHATDVLLSEDQIWMFGQVIERLALELEVEAHAHLARRLANSKNAPINCVEKLAYDDSISVADLFYDSPGESMCERWFRLLLPKASTIFLQYPEENPSPNQLQTCWWLPAIKRS
jgi:hypothetical protein